jgi:hypothetical protein
MIKIRQDLPGDFQWCGYNQCDVNAETVTGASNVNVVGRDGDVRWRLFCTGSKDCPEEEREDTLKLLQ